MKCIAEYCRYNDKGSCVVEKCAFPDYRSDIIRNDLVRLFKERGIRVHALAIKDVRDYKPYFDLKIEGWLELDKKQGT